MRVVMMALLPCLLGLVGICGSTLAKESNVHTVDRVDLNRYVGTWYAIASIPTTFERQCAQGTTATYTLLENGRIEVVNTCFTKKGKESVAKGRAWIPDPEEPAKLKVSFVSLFGWWLFPGDYWIIDLDQDYQYAVVGHPARRYGWILSRTPVLPDSVLTEIFARIEAQGYDVSTFRTIDQSIHMKETGGQAPPSEGTETTPSDQGE